MISRWALGILIVMNAGLLVSHWGLSQALAHRWGPERLEALEAKLGQAAGLLSAERARLAEKVEALRAFNEGRRTETAEKEPMALSPSGTLDPKLDSLLEEAGIEEKPDPFSLAPLTEEELLALKKVWRSLPPLEDKALLFGDLGALLADPLWNPDRRQLDPEEQRALARLAKDYKYFQRVAPIERHTTFVEPIVPQLREAGAYVELEDGQYPPRLQRERHSHAERGPDGKLRLYYFYPEDYPDLFHHKRVCEQQGRVTLVRAYELINSTQ